jgi:hypothetical protein
MADPKTDQDFRTLFSQTENRPERTPASLKARLYTKFVRMQGESGRLASLDASFASGERLCVFEKLVQIAPVGEAAKSPFFCETCHARVLAEHFDNPPIFWPNCPYVKFKES